MNKTQEDKELLLKDLCAKRIIRMEKFHEKLTKDFLQAEDIEEINRIVNIVRTMQDEI